MMFVINLPASDVANNFNVWAFRHFPCIPYPGNNLNEIMNKITNQLAIYECEKINRMLL